MSDVWREQARQWTRIGAPLRPSPEDVAHLCAAVSPALQDGGAVLVLGVTPELVQAAWPQASRLEAVDHSADMIERVWAPNPGIASQVRQADWRALPMDDACFRAAVGDNALGALPTLDDYADVLHDVHRVLAADARLALRAFARPAQPETLDDVAADALAGRVQGFHALKWRVAMTLSEAPTYSVAVAHIHAAFERAFPDRACLAAITGWPRATIDTIDAYRDAATRYSFPTLAAIEHAASPWFERVGIAYGHYELAERCPVIAWRAR